MRNILLFILCIFFLSCKKEGNVEEKSLMTSAEISLTSQEAGRLSQMAYGCIDQEYPNKLGQVLGDSSYLATPRELHPAFYGCFDWHSAVHGHWSLVRVLKSYPEIESGSRIRSKLANNLTAENIKQEVLYFHDEHNKNYERTYGWAWLLKLVAELDDWEDAQGQAWRENLRPLEELVVQKYLEFLPKLSYPIRVGEHPNTAFGLTFAWDYAQQVGQKELTTLIANRSKDYYLNDKACPLSWEPGGFDFLSPCLQEADIMSRVLPQKDFEEWFADFLPNLQNLKPATVSDRSDGKIVHLDGLNYSRAWVLYRLSERIPEQEDAFIFLADQHMAASLSKITAGDYAGGHWLASFALYALSCKESLSQ